MIGEKHGNLKIVYYAGKDAWGKNLWLCYCSCGEERILGQSDLKTGNTKSCGCLKTKLLKETSKYGSYNKRLYSIWAGVKSRCLKPQNKGFMNYGGRGIKIFDAWVNDFMIFHEWALNNGYNDSLTIERIDVDGDYCPENCTWITRAEQNRNMRTNKRIEYKGEIKTFAQICRDNNIKPQTARDRLNRGWSFIDAVEKPLKSR